MIIIVLSVGVVILMDSLGKSKPIQLATWLWDTTLIQKAPNQVISSLKEEGIRSLYLYIDRTIPMNHYREFIRNASEEHIEVYALQGEPNWATDAGEQKSSELRIWLNDYRQAAQQKEQFAGIHLDVEPYLLTEWKTHQMQVIVHYQKLINSWKREAMVYPQGLGLDIPFWYDEVRLSQQSLFEWVMDRVDSVTIMSYRNQVEGSNGILEITSSERNYAKATGKKLYLGVETEPSHEGEHISIDSYPALKQTLAELWGKVPEVEGISIHHFGSWSQLKEKLERNSGFRF